MATATTNLKYNIGADTSGFTKGAKDVKKGLTDLKKTTDEFKGSLGAAFGLDTGKIEQFASAIQGLGTKFGKMGAEGDAAMKAMLTSVGLLTGAIAGIGIGAAVAAFKVLKDDAEAFKKTIEGANIELQTQAYLSTYEQSLRDTTGVGEGAAKAWDTATRSLKKWWIETKQELSALLKAAGTTGNTEQIFQDLYQSRLEAEEKAERAAQIQKEIYELQLQQIENGPELARLQADLAEQYNKVRDTSLTVAERQAAIAKYEKLANDQYDLQYGTLSRIRDLTVELHGLASSSVDDLKEDMSLTAQVEALERQRLQTIGTISRQRNAIANDAQAEAEAMAKIASIEQSRASLADFAAQGRDLMFNNPLQQLADSGLASTNAGELTIAAKIEPYIDEGEVIDLSQQISSLMADSLATMASTIGELIGDLATGGDAWENFANSAVSAFGDMAISIGKLAISAGVTTLAIKGSLMSLNGYGAIAAGVALVALGAAVKAGMSNIASEGTGSAASIASSQYSYSSDSGWDIESMKVEVVGTLKASGSDLVAVLNSENKRRSHTT